MNFSRKMLIFVLTLLLLVFTVACGGNNETASVDEGEKVELFTDKADNELAFNEISNAISKDTNVKLEFVGYTGATAYQTAIQQSLGKENSPGLFTWWSGHRLDSLVETGQLADLTSEWENYYTKSGVNPQLADAFKINGKIYGAPLAILYNGIFYNKEIFDKYNLEVPQTFDDFLENCEILKSNGVTPIGLRNDPWASFLWFQQLVGSFDPELYTGLTSGEIPYNDKQVVEVLKIWKSMLDKGYFAEPVDYVTEGKQFANGDVAMVYGPPIRTKALEEDYGMKEEKDYSIFILPPMNSSDQSVIFYEASPIVVSSSSLQKDAGIKALRELYGKEEQQIYADHMNVGFVEGVEIKNQTSQKITELANSGDYSLMIRYYEATPSEIVSEATDNLWKFFFKPDDANLEKTLDNIQKKAEETFSN